ncbi:MAG TPA: glycosyltransferase 87 family protein, partial [Ktedonobacterales bacterium]
ALAALVCLSWAPAEDTITFGQINFLVLLPLALVPGLLRSGRERWAGAAIGVAAMIKLTPLLLLAYLALTGRLRTLVAALGTLAALAALTIAVVGPHVAFAAVGQALHVGGYDASLNQNEALLGLVTLALVTTAPTAAGIIRVCEYTVLTALAAWIGTTLWVRLGNAAPKQVKPKQERAFTGNDALAYAAALCGFVLISPLAWLHHYLWLLPAATLALAVMVQRWLLAAGNRRRPAARRLLLTLLASLMISLPLPNGWDRLPWLAGPHLLGYSLANWMHEIRGCGALLLLGLALGGLREVDKTGAAGPSGAGVASTARIPYTVGGRRARRSLVCSWRALRAWL